MIRPSLIALAAAAIAVTAVAVSPADARDGKKYSAQQRQYSAQQSTNARSAGPAASPNPAVPSGTALCN
jgi:hypothetical protein